MAKLNIFFMKPNNLTSLRRMSRVRLAWRGFLTILQSELNVLQGQRLHTLLHPYSALSLILRALGPTSLKYDFKDACEILDNLFIDNYIKIKADTGMFYDYYFFPTAM